MLNRRALSETDRLHMFLAGAVRPFNPRQPARQTHARQLPAVSGWDEMQGYGENVYGDDYNGPPTVGLSWGDIGHGINLAVNPVAQYHWLANKFRGGGGGPQRIPQQGPRMPTAPMLPPTAMQALARGPAKLLSYMGLGSLVWDHTTTQTEQSMSAEPQAAFRGRRLVIAQAKSAGAVGILATITNPLTVSGMPQTPAPNEPAPVEMFEASTTYSMLDLQIATSATQITLGISVSAIPASGETVAVAAGLYGEWLR
jgi:hypothetical protein